MPKKKANRKYDIDGDPMFDVSAEAKSNALDRQLIRLLERIETIREEKKDRASDERDVFAEGKALGYDTKIMRRLLKLREMNPDDLAELDALLDTYRRATGL